MSKKLRKVYIELTDEQREKLFPLFDQVMAANEILSPGILMAQIHYTGKDAVAICAFIENKTAIEVIKVIKPENAGKLVGEKYTKDALKKARK